MGKIALSEGFTVIPEGTHIFKIVEVNYSAVYIMPLITTLLPLPVVPAMSVCGCFNMSV